MVPIESNDTGRFILNMLPSGVTPLSFGVGGAFAKALAGNSAEGLLQSIVPSAINSVTKAGLTGQQIAQNEWTAQREDTQYQRLIDDLQKAGLNPAMLFGKSAQPVSSPSAGDNGASVAGSFSNLLELATLPQKIRSMELENELKQKEIDWYEAEHGTKVDLANASIDEIRQSIEESKSRISNNDADTDLKRANISKADAETALTWSQYAAQEMDNDFKAQLNPLLIRARELENSLLEVRSEYEEKRILAELAEKRASINCMYAEAALAGARKQNIDFSNEYLSKQKPFFADMAKREAQILVNKAVVGSEQQLQAKYATKNAKYYSEHYEEAFRNQWSKSSSTYGYTEMIGRGIGAAVATGMMLSAF